MTIKTFLGRVIESSGKAVAAMVVCLFVGGLAWAQNPIPFVNAPLVPGAKAPGAAAFTLTVNGSGFVSGATVYWNASSRTTTFISSSQLTASINAADVKTAQTASVKVVNPTPGGGTSNVAFFDVIKSGYTVDFSHIDYATGNSPQAIVSGDFNNDGKLDLITCNGDNTLSFLKGNGDGTFQAPTSINGTGHPIAIIAGDFNGDGKLDLATADQYIAAITVLLGNGDGTFQAAVLYNTGNQPVALEAADFNKDGKLDIVTADFNDAQVGVLLGNGDGTFQTFKGYASGNGPSSVAIGDFNLDGKLDLAVANNTDSTVAVLLGNGDGTFGAAIPFPTSINPNSVVTGDFSGDGLLDLAVGTSNKAISVLKGNGNGTFQNYTNYTVGANSALVAVADLSGDGKLDLISANFGDNTVSTLVGNGDSTFKSQGVTPAGLGPIGVAVGDFANSGKMGIAAANTNANSVSILTSSLVTVSPGLLTFGTQTSGFPSPTKTVTVKNNGTKSYTLGAISMIGAFYTDFTQTNNCPTTLAAGASCTFTVTFTPTASENANAQLLMTPASGAILGFQMTGTGNIPITLNPRTITFGFQLLYTTSKTKTATFTNKSGVNIIFSLIDLEGINQNDFLITSASTCLVSNPLPPGASCTIVLTYTPTIVGGETTTLVFYGNFTLQKQGSLVSGQGTAVTYSPTSLTYSAQTVGTCSSAKTVTFTNVGPVSLPITSVTFTGTNNDWTETNTCQPSVAANSSCTFSVTFCPTGTGSRSAQMNIGDSDPTGPQVVTLSGTGQ